MVMRVSNRYEMERNVREMKNESRKLRVEEKRDNSRRRQLIRRYCSEADRKNSCRKNSCRKNPCRKNPCRKNSIHSKIYASTFVKILKTHKELSRVMGMKKMLLRKHERIKKDWDKNFCTSNVNKFIIEMSEQKTKNFIFIFFLPTSSKFKPFLSLPHSHGIPDLHRNVFVSIE